MTRLQRLCLIVCCLTLFEFVSNTSSQTVETATDESDSDSVELATQADESSESESDSDSDSVSDSDSDSDSVSDSDDSESDSDDSDSDSEDSDSSVELATSEMSSSDSESSDLSSSDESSVEECFGILDCAGVCNGDALEDCAGQCNGNATHDCANECNGDATINGCNECVGGRTGRAANFGMDKCGVCKSLSTYTITWDCHGTCYGNATIDSCLECVGGDTGRTEIANDGRLDCRDICDGGWITDDCSHCVPPRSDNSTTSIWMDCSGTCVDPPGIDMAYENDCGVCVGNGTGLAADSGTNVCGCDSEVSASSCLDCAGVPNGGKAVDACGVCGGLGNTCFAVGGVTPNFIAENTTVELTVTGAGFDSDTIFCVFTSEDGQTAETAMVAQQSIAIITCNTPSLPEGVYNVSVRMSDASQPSVTTTELAVHPVVEIASVSPTEVDLNSVDEITIVVTADSSDAFAEIRNSSFANPSLIISGAIYSESGVPNSDVVITGEFTADDEMSFVIDMPLTSCLIEVIPSLNGHTALGNSGAFNLTVISPAPVLSSAKFSNNGASLLVTFDGRVDSSSLSDCDDIFDDASTAELGTEPTCFFRQTDVLVVIVGKSATIVPSDELTLRDGNVKAFQEDISHVASGNVTVDGPDQPLQPLAVLQGSPMIPSCGDVRISGRKSTGSGARSMTYAWDVESSGSTTSVDAALANTTTADLSLTGSLLDADTPYNFSLTVTNFLSESDTTYFIVERSSLALPEVNVVAKGVDVTSASVADSFDLTAEVTFYSACVPAGETIFSWAVDNSEVPLNLKTVDKRTLHVDANSLPGDETITFTVSVYKSSDSGNVVTASISVDTVSSELVPIIRGSLEMTVGRDSGDLEIDGSNSYDPDEVASPMTYAWSCVQETDNTACYSFMSGQEGALFPLGAVSSSAVLSIDALNMQADKTYAFTLTITKLTRQASATVYISAVSGNPPQVIVELDGGENNKVTVAENVPIKAIIKHSVALSSVTFDSAIEDGFGYFDFSDEANLVTTPQLHTAPDGETSFTQIIIRSGLMRKGTSYKVLVTATDEDDQSSVSALTFDVRAGVTSCDFTVAGGAASYTEMETVDYLLENCVADEDAYPLTYQIYVTKDDDGKVEALNQKGSEPSISVVGKPARDGTNNNTFVARVCDRYSCEEYSTDVDVTVKASFSASEITDFRSNQIEPLEYQGDYLGALINTNLLNDKTAGGRRKRAAASTSSEQSALLSLVENIIETSVLSTDDAVLLIDQMSALVASDMDLQDQDNFVDAMVEVSEIFSSTDDAVIGDESARVLLVQIQEVATDLDPEWNDATLDKCRDAISKLMKSLMRGKSVGDGPTDISSTGVTLRIEKDVLDNTFTTAGGASIDFGDDLKNTYTAAWTCDSGICSGASVKTEHYDSGVDLLSTTTEDKTSRATDVLQIELADPESDETLNVTGLSSPITVNLTINSPASGLIYTCKYWDDTTSAWSTDGVTTIENDDNTVQCLSTHLSTFGAFSTAAPTTVVPTTAGDQTTDTATVVPTTSGVIVLDDDSSNTALIIGCVVGVVVLATAAAIIAVVVIKCKKPPSKVGDDPEVPLVDRTATPPRAQSNSWDVNLNDESKTTKPTSSGEESSAPKNSSAASVETPRSTSRPPSANSATMSVSHM